jgi:hypothetical protein
MALAKNTKTGETVTVPAHYLGHPVLGKNLVAVGTEAPAAPKKEKKKEQPAPEVELVVAEPEPIINENEELEDGN